jgi:hypothetical protein
MSDWNIPTFLFAADEIDDLTLSQACETIENENYAFENLGILSFNNEAENATLTQACEMVENTRCDMEDFTFSYDLNEYLTIMEVFLWITTLLVIFFRRLSPLAIF